MQNFDNNSYIYVVKKIVSLQLMSPRPHHSSAACVDDVFRRTSSAVPATTAETQKPQPSGTNLLVVYGGCEKILGIYLARLQQGVSNQVLPHSYSREGASLYVYLAFFLDRFGRRGDEASTISGGAESYRFQR